MRTGPRHQRGLESVGAPGGRLRRDVHREAEGGQPLDLAPFWSLVADPSVIKIVHAGDSDVEPVVRHLGRAPANIFDTQIAAMVAGFGDQVGYEAI